MRKCRISVYRRLESSRTRTSASYELSKTLGRNKRQGISDWNRHFSNSNCVQQTADQANRVSNDASSVHSSVIWRIYKHHVTPVTVHAMNFFSINSLVRAQRTPCPSLTSPPSISSAQSSANLSCRFRDECINLFQFARSPQINRPQNENGHRRNSYSRTLGVVILRLHEKLKYVRCCERISARPFRKH